MTIIINEKYFLLDVLSLETIKAYDSRNSLITLVRPIYKIYGAKIYYGVGIIQFFYGINHMKFRISKDIEGQFVERVYHEHLLKERQSTRVEKWNLKFLDI